MRYICLPKTRKGECTSVTILTFLANLVFGFNIQNVLYFKNCPRCTSILFVVCVVVCWQGEGEAGVAEGAGDDVVLHKSRGVERTEEDGAADAEFEAMLSKTMSESVEKTKIARATTQVSSVCTQDFFQEKKWS